MKKLINLIHRFQDYLKSERIKAEQAKGDMGYLVNAYTDIPTMKELIKGTDRRIDIFLADGTHLVVSADEKKKTSRRGIWNY